MQRSADVHHRTFAQLKPGVSPAQAKAATAVIGRALHLDDPRNGLGAETAIKGIVFDEYASPGLLIGTALVSLSVLVFLIACANLTNLLLARNRTRTVEVAIRLATGAGRSRIFRLLFVETALVTAIGAVGAVAITFGGTALMARVPTAAARTASRSLLIPPQTCTSSSTRFSSPCPRRSPSAWCRRSVRHGRSRCTCWRRPPQAAIRAEGPACAARSSRRR